MIDENPITACNCVKNMNMHYMRNPVLNRVMNEIIENDNGPFQCSKRFRNVPFFRQYIIIFIT